MPPRGGGIVISAWKGQIGIPKSQAIAEVNRRQGEDGSGMVCSDRHKDVTTRQTDPKNNGETTGDTKAVLGTLETQRD